MLRLLIVLLMLASAPAASACEVVLGGTVLVSSATVATPLVVISVDPCGYAAETVLLSTFGVVEQHVVRQRVIRRQVVRQQAVHHRLRLRGRTLVLGHGIILR